MGRKKSFVWAYFTTILVGRGAGSSAQGQNKDNSTAALCNFCQSRFDFPNATRMITHLAEVCRQCPENIKKKAKDASPSKPIKRRVYEVEDNSCDEANPQPVSENHQIPSPTNGHQMQFKPTTSRASSSATPTPTGNSASASTMHKFASVTSEKQKAKIDKALARAVYDSGVPFSIFENPYWKEAINLLRPSYDAPSRKRIGGPLLDDEHEKVMQSAFSTTKGAPCIAIILDGWTNVRKEQLVNFLVATPKTVFLKTVQPRTNRETGDYLAGEILKVIDELVRDGVDVMHIFLVLSDNAANMRAARQKIKERYPHIVFIGCSGHTLNLLITDLMKQPSTAMMKDQAKTIVKKITNHHVANAVFKEKQKGKYGEKSVSLKVPPQTRWFYLVLCLYSLKCNKAALQATVIEENIVVDKSARDLVLDPEFWDRLNSIYQLLLPVARAIHLVESDGCTLSDALVYFKELDEDVQLLIKNCSILGEEEKGKMSTDVIERVYLCIDNVHCAANLLDPRYLGKHLDSAEKQSALEFIGEQCENLSLDKGTLLANLAEFRTKTGFFSNDSLWQAVAHTNPAVWWGGLCADQPLYPLAQRLFNVPPTSASCERNWSTHGFIHSKKRNRLRNDKVQKQVAIKSNLRFTANAVSSPRKKRKPNKCLDFSVYPSTSASAQAGPTVCEEDELNLLLNYLESDSDWSDCETDCDCDTEED